MLFWNYDASNWEDDCEYFTSDVLKADALLESIEDNCQFKSALQLMREKCPECGYESGDTGGPWVSALYASTEYGEEWLRRVYDDLNEAKSYAEQARKCDQVNVASRQLNHKWDETRKAWKKCVNKGLRHWCPPAGSKYPPDHP